MYHLCTTAIFRTIYHKRKILDIRLNIKDFSSVGVTGFEPATTRPPDEKPVGQFGRPDTVVAGFEVLLRGGGAVTVEFGVGVRGARRAAGRSEDTFLKGRHGKKGLKDS